MKGCDKQKNYKEEKQNIVDVIIKVPKNLVCKSLVYFQVVYVDKDLEP